MDESGPLIGVVPDSAWAQRRRFFDVLEQAFAVRFEGRRPGDWQGLAMALRFGPEIEVPARLPCPSLTYLSESESVSARRPIRLAFSQALDFRLRGREIQEAAGASRQRLELGPADEVLASDADGPVWAVRGPVSCPHHVVLVAPAELANHETLRDRLRPGRFLGLLPLVEMLRRIQPARPWTEPPARACFIIDDPNLRAARYGYVDYRALVAHAVRGGYHVSIASIPLDYGTVDASVSELFRRNRDAVSLVIHGNNHQRDELLGITDAQTGLRLAAQALRRGARFEQRTGLGIERVMCAPHEECNPAMLPALVALGFDAMTLVPRDRVSAQGQTPNGPLAGWEPAQILMGLPVLPRFGLPAGDDDLAFHDYLNLPKIFFLHHGDLKAGPQVLDALAARINRLRPHRWLSPGAIAGSNSVAWQHDRALTVRLYSRQIAVTVPSGIDRVIVEAPGLVAGAPVVIRCNGTTVNAHRAEFRGPFPDRVAIALDPVTAVLPDAIRAPRWRPWPRLRRVLTESRDRAAALTVK
jgi:hypothetical protein